MAYYELNVKCERCGTTAIYVGHRGRRSAIAAAKSEGWYPAVGTFMWICGECQKPDGKATSKEAA
jgi:hypothetical protein